MDKGDKGRGADKGRGIYYSVSGRKCMVNKYNQLGEVDTGEEKRGL